MARTADPLQSFSSAYAAPNSAESFTTAAAPAQNIATWATQSPTPAAMHTEHADDGDGEGDGAAELARHPAVAASVLFAYAFVFGVGLVSNVLVVLVVVQRRELRTITNTFCCNLAIADVMLCALAVPFTPLPYFLEHWPFGVVICHVLPMTLAVAVYVSTLTSTAIAIDRYFVIVHPFLPRMSMWLCLTIIAVVWLVAVLISLPLAVYQQLRAPGNGSEPNASAAASPADSDADDERLSCQEQWPDVDSRSIFTVSSFVLQFVAPCSVISYCYTRVSFVLRNRLRTRRLVHAASAVLADEASVAGDANGLGALRPQVLRERDLAEIRRKRRTNRMLVSMVLVFCCCWIPLNAIHIVGDLLDKAEWYKYYNAIVFFLAHMSAMSSTISNPVLYALMNSKVKKEMVRMFAASGLACFRRRSARSASESRAGGASDAPSEWRERRCRADAANELTCVVKENSRAVSAAAAPTSTTLCVSAAATDSTCASASVAKSTPQSSRHIGAQPPQNGDAQAHSQPPLHECSHVESESAALRTSHL